MYIIDILLISYDDPALEVFIFASFLILTGFRHQHLKHIHQRTSQVTLTSSHKLLQLTKIINAKLPLGNHKLL